MACHAGKGGGMVVTRELEGKLYAGHESFEWLLSVITFVMSAEVRSRDLQSQSTQC